MKRVIFKLMSAIGDNAALFRSVTKAEVLILAERIWLLSKSSDIQRWIAVPTEILLARLPAINVNLARNIALTYCVSSLNIFTLPLGKY